MGSIFCDIREHGLSAGLAARSLKKGGGATLLEAMSPDMYDLMESLLCLDPTQRACLGEAIFQREVLGGHRRAVWDFKWMEDLRAPAASTVSLSLEGNIAEAAVDATASELQSSERARVGAGRNPS